MSTTSKRVRFQGLFKIVDDSSDRFSELTIKTQFDEKCYPVRYYKPYQRFRLLKIEYNNDKHSMSKHQIFSKVQVRKVLPELK